MSPKLSQSRPGFYRRLRGSLSRGLVSPREQELKTWKEATLELAFEAVRARDADIAAYCGRVAELAARLAGQLDLNPRSVRLIHTAGRLHDLGLIGVRDDIVKKAGALRDDELKVLRRHPDIGADMMAWHPALAEATPLVRHHHERWDGSGYPARLRGEVIPLGARILAVAEAFDTITTKRIYRANARTTADAIADIADHSGSWYDPTVVDALRSLYR
jgi:response regulator RpfG family c-di-GMP phosphodiesterase